MRTERIALAPPVLGWTMVVAGGLIISTAAVIALPESRTLATPGARLVPNPPEVVGLAVLALFGLASLLILGLLWPRGVRRRRKKGDDEFELYYERPPISPWVALVLVLLVVMLVAAIVGAVWFGWPWSTPGHGGRGLPSPAAPANDVSAPHGAVDKPSASIAAYDVAVAVVGIAAGAIILGVMVWLYVGDRVMRWWVGRIFDRDARSLRAAAEESLEELRREPDARRAIIRCYQRFERALAAARVPRAPWQTPAEFMRAVLGTLALPREAVRALTALFELSRFSERRLGATERDVACDCLEDIKAALDRSEQDATPA